MERPRSLKGTLLSIAGFDSGNGAGVETDIRVFDSLGFHGAGVITAITAQNTTGVKRVFPLPPEEVREQISAVVNDFLIKGVKTGMVYDAPQINVIIEELHKVRKEREIPLIVDPVIFAKDGTPLIKDVESFKRLMEGAFAITPNAVEASILLGKEVTEENQHDACRELLSKFSTKYVILKGGHMLGETSRDVLCWDSGEEEVTLPRLKEKNTHGTGSVLASAILAYYVKYKDMMRALSEAKLVVHHGIRHGLHVGKGIGPIDTMVSMRKGSCKHRVMEDMYKFAKFVHGKRDFYKLIPEVQSNFAHSIDPDMVDGIQDIATFEGRIVKEWNGNVRIGFPAVFGYPTHTARLLLGLINRGVRADSLINVRFDEAFIETLSRKGYEVLEIDRENEPSWGENKTMDWIASISAEKGVNVAFDRGMKGKEAMIRIWSFGTDSLMDILETLLGSSE